MENRFKSRFSRIFRSPFGSCGSREVSDVVQNTIFASESHHPNLESIKGPQFPLKPKAQSFPSICRPSRQETENSVQNSFAPLEGSLLKNRAPENRKPRSVSANSEGNSRSPASPIPPFNPLCKYGESDFGEKSKKSMKKKKKKKKTATTTTTTRSRNKNNIQASNGFSFSSSGDETETFFSSKSNTLSSDSSGTRRKQCGTRRKHNGVRRRRFPARNGSELRLFPVEGKVKDSVAVVKRSSDPYGDFRTSMVEMIIERQIFGAEDLEQLLQCFLSLNSTHHHRVIVEVFVEIWESLFCE